MRSDPQYGFCDPEIYQNPENIIARCDKGPRGNGRVNAPFVQEKWDKSPDDPSDNNHGNQGD
jgi:hypothetical protein